MTIIAGLICVDCIVLASDSQTTDPTGTKRLDAKKISIVKLADAQAIVAQAGNADLSSRAVEMLASKAKDRKLDDYRAVADLAQEVVGALKRDLMSQYQGASFSMEEYKSHFDDYSFELMIAHFFQNKPYIFTIDFALGSATLQQRASCAIGCGHTLADYLLNLFDVPKMKIGEAIAAAVYVLRPAVRS